MNPLLGSIMLWPFDWAPQSWLLCNGQSLSIKQNSALHSLMGNTYGGDDANFMLPNMKNVTTTSGAELRYIICIQGVFPSRY